MKSLIGMLTAMAALAVAGTASASVVLYAGTLSGAAESPVNASAGTGTMLITIDDVLNTMRVDVNFFGLSGPVTASHIHCCTATAGVATAGVATTTPYFAGFPIGVLAGSYDNTLDMTQATSFNSSFITANGGTTASAFTALLAGIQAGKAYLNIHTTFAPGGEIRAFLTPTPVPLPASAWLLLTGLAGMVMVSRRKQGLLSRF